ncbi:MAG: nitrilase-related carbon-nitrogen hydrolase, partial [Bacillota bacterium]
FRHLAVIVVIAIAVGLVFIISSGSGESPIKTLEPSEVARPEKVKFVAVQSEVNRETYSSREAFREKIFAEMERADAEVSLGEDTLVAFPEDVGMLTVLFGQGDVLAEANGLADGMERVIRSNLISVGYHKFRYGVSWPRAVFMAFGDRMGEAYFEIFSEVADRYDVYLVAGSTALSDATLRRFVPDDVPGAGDWKGGSDARSVYNVSALFGPGGEVLGIQRKVNLIDLEGPEGLDLSAASRDELGTVATPLGEIGIAICLDAFDSGVLDQLEDADILVQPSANPGPWERWQQEEWLESSWSAVVRQERFDVAVNPMLTGQILDVGFFGQSSIIAGGDISKSSHGYRDLEELRGFLDVASDDRESGIVHATIGAPSAGE